MDLILSDEQQMLRDTARSFLEAKSPSETVRQLMETDEGFDAATWSEIAAQGWLGMAIPEEHGGAGFTFMEQAVLMEEMGRVLFPAPYLSTVVIGADLILRAGTEQQRAEILPEIATGERRVAVAHLEASGSWGPEGIGLVARADGEDLILDGSKAYVLDGHTADTLIVVARRDEGSTSADDIVLVLVDGTAAGVTRQRVETLDTTRKQAEVSLDGVRVGAEAILAGGWAELEETLSRAAVALAFEQVGGAQKCLEMSVMYAMTRVQFGRPIGSFQAIKHKCSDMLVELEGARSAAHYAGWAITADDDDRHIAGPMAKAYCSEAFFHAASETIQIHGGIGFTWEHDAHLYFKRAASSRLLFGEPAQQRAVLAERLGI